MQPIFLIGYMGCGKSTVGRLTAQLTGWRFIDLDHYIENRYHATITELFARHGEEEFRRREQAMLHEVAEFEDVIVACGGGTPCFFDNMEWMNTHGTTVWLDAGIDRLHTRLIRGKHKRPLIASKSDDELRDFIIAALDKRRPYYSQATRRFDSDLLDNNTEKVVTALRFADFLNLPVIEQLP